MNSIWNKNVFLLKERFPQLYSMLQNNINEIELAGKKISDSLDADFLLSMQKIFPFWKPSISKSGLPTVSENGIALHSIYNPQKEADQLLENVIDSETDTVFFFAFGLGYAPVQAAKIFPNKTIIAIEPDATRLLATFAVLDWEPFFKVRNCIIITQCEPGTVVQFLDRAGNKAHYKIIGQKNQTSHEAQWFKTLEVLVRRNQNKNEINTNTLEKFSSLWLKNSCKNLSYFANLDGISIYKNAIKTLESEKKISSVILAAGPTLSEILPHLKEIKKRAIIICVDTALRMCLKAGVEPDFIILVDPQYYAARHIMGLSSPSSVMITESAAYPCVYRFPCRKTVLCSSLFPLGKYFESHLGEKGTLCAGGSVATTAWDFAVYIGSSAIYTAGLDLSYPQKQTHIKGSTFEQNIHTCSNRIKTAETAGSGMLFGMYTETSKNYDGEDVITDQKMKMFAWWFESKIAGLKSSAKPYPETYTFSTKGLGIPGIIPCTTSSFLQLPDITSEKSVFFEKSENPHNSANSNIANQNTFQTSITTKNTESKEEAFNIVLKQLISSFQDLYDNSKKGLQLCSKFLENTAKHSDTIATQKLFEQLDNIDKTIMANETKDVAALVFPTERRLEEIMASKKLPENPALSNIIRSSVIYRELCNSIQKYQKILCFH